MKTIFCVLCVLMLTWATDSRAELLNRIVATVDGQAITLYELQAFKKQAKQGGMFAPQDAVNNMSDQQVLDGLIMNKLVDQEVETQGLKAKDGDVDSYIERIKMQNKMTDEQFKAALVSQGLTPETHRKQVGQEIGRAMLVNREIGARVNVTPQDIERYYKTQGKSYAQPEQVKVRVIFLPLPVDAPSDKQQEVMTQIQDLRKRATGGEDFAALANANSQGPGVGQGGDLGTFRKGQLVKDLDEVAFTLKAGEISKPIRTGVGFYLVKVDERIAAGQRPADEDVEEIKRKLYNDALRQRYERWFQEDLRFRHNVENFLTDATGATTAVTGTPTGLFSGGPIDNTPPSEAAPEDQGGGFLSEARQLWKRITKDEPEGK